MAKATTKTHTTGQDEAMDTMAALFPIGRMLNDNGHSLEAWTQMGRTLLDRMAALQSETTRFVAKRLEEDLARQRELIGCRTPSEALDVYNAFTRKAVQDYVEEAGRVSEITSEITRACTTFGESLTASAVQAAKTDGTQAPTPMAATAKAAEDARAEIAA